MQIQTFQPLTEEELGQIESRIEAATAGPWFSYLGGQDLEPGSRCIELGVCNELGSFKCIELVNATTADQEFIASARQDLPRLLLEVRAMRACLEAVRAEPQQRGSAVDGSASRLSLTS